MWVCMRCECLRCTVCSKKIVSSADLWDSKYSKRKSIGVEYPSQSSTFMFICQCPSTIVIIYLWAIQLLNWWLMRLLQSSCQASTWRSKKNQWSVWKLKNCGKKYIQKFIYIVHVIVVKYFSYHFSCFKTRTRPFFWVFGQLIDPKKKELSSLAARLLVQLNKPFKINRVLVA